MKKHIDDLQQLALRGEHEKICKKLKEIIPNFDHRIYSDIN
jgi:hypothetical protein